MTVFEKEVMVAVSALGSNAYGVTIADHLEQSTGKRPTIGKLYSALNRLVEEGLLSDRMGEPTKERGGRRKRFFHAPLTS